MKLKNKQSETLIKSYIAEVLKASGRQRIIEYIVDDSSGYAGAVGTSSELFNTFIKPFTDVIGTAVGKTKEAMRSGVTLLQVSFETLMTTLVPFLTDSYDEIFAKEKADLQKIRSEYQQYYDSTAKALGSPDASLLAFMAFPGATLTGKFVKDSPKVAKGILSVATGGMSDKILGNEGGGFKSSRKGPGDIFDSYIRAYNQLLSEDDKTKDKDTLSSRIGSKKLIDAIIDRSPTMKSAEKEALQLYRTNLAKRIEPILSILDADSIEELSKVLKKPLTEPDLSELDPDKKISAMEMQKKSFESIKNTAVQAAMQQIESHIMPVRQKFGDDHPYVQGYTQVLQAIKSADPNQLKQIKQKLGLSQ